MRGNEKRQRNEGLKGECEEMERKREERNDRKGNERKWKITGGGTTERRMGENRKKQRKE